MTAPAEQPATTSALLALAISRGVRADIPSEVQISLELFRHGLLEKGARAVSPHAWDDDNGWTEDTYADVQNNAREITERVLDAVLPGWREGISREWAATLDGRPAGPYFADRTAAESEGLDLINTFPDRSIGLSARLRWVGPWLPVEDGTE